MWGMVVTLQFRTVLTTCHLCKNIKPEIHEATVVRRISVPRLKGRTNSEVI